LQDIRNNWKKEANFFQVAIHFHPNHLQQNTLVVSDILNGFEVRLCPFYREAYSELPWLHKSELKIASKVRRVAPKKRYEQFGRVSTSSISKLKQLAN